MTMMAAQITSLTGVYSTVYSDANQRNIKVPRHWPLCGEITGTGEFPAQRASYAENVSIWWRHHDGLAPNRRQTIIWTNADPVHWHIYAALGEDELTVGWRISLVINISKYLPRLSSIAGRHRHHVCTCVRWYIWWLSIQHLYLWTSHRRSQYQ